MDELLALTESKGLLAAIRSVNIETIPDPLMRKRLYRAKEMLREIEASVRLYKVKSGQ